MAAVILRDVLLSAASPGGLSFFLGHKTQPQDPAVLHYDDRHCECFRLQTPRSDPAALALAVIGHEADAYLEREGLQVLETRLEVELGASIDRYDLVLTCLPREPSPARSGL